METLLAILTSMMLSYAPYNPTDVTIDRDEAFCLAQNVYHEAKGENLAGKSAVAHVTLNRVEHRKYPNSICGVTKQAKLRYNWRGNEVPVIGLCQFSWYCDGKSDDIQVVYYKGNKLMRMFNRSPLFYMGDKYKLLPEISKYFPKNINV